jgi:5-oxoprolinase (ATP-hydrolysing)
VNVRTPGLFGGKPGGSALGRVVKRNGELISDCGAGELVTIGSPDEIIEIVLAGGSGYGDPRERSRESVRRDVALGLVTPKSAAADYGVLDECPSKGTESRPDLEIA